MVRDGRHSRIRGSKKYGKIQTMGMSTLVSARQCTVSKCAIRNISSSDCRLAAQRGKGAEPNPPPEFCVFLHIWEMSEKVLARGLTRPPKGGSATMATLRPSRSVRKVCSSVLEAYTHTHTHRHTSPSHPGRLSRLVSQALTCPSKKWWLNML